MYKINSQQILLSVLLLAVISINSTAADCSPQCNPNAFCNQYSNGDSCCKCNDGFNGNGVNCFQKDESITFRGKLNGNINNVKLENLDVHAYVYTLPSDSRNYVAIGRLPGEIGNKATLLLPFATPIHWIFAGSSSNALNGFSLTGGVFTRQSDSTFFNEQGDQIGTLYISQNFTGLGESLKEIEYGTFVEGSLPELASDEQVIYPDYDEKYEYRSNIENPDTRKVIETRSSIKYLVTSVRDTRLRKFRIEHNERIHFTVCQSSNKDDLSQNAASVLLMTKRLSVSFIQRDSQVKFSSANFIRALNSQEPNPCASNDCSLFAECIVASDTQKGYFCQCKPGFEEDGDECKETNECEEGNHCSPYAECKNFFGYFECLCIEPRVGDGRNCELETDANPCSDCDSNASCISDQNSNFCVCNNGFVGNGYDCRREEYNPDYQPTQQATRPTTPTTTRVRLEHKDKCQDCNVFATCALQQGTGSECCTCLEGYIGNGKYCIPDATPIYVTGKVFGTVNNEKLDDLDLYAYVLTHSSDSRNFVAIGKIPANLGSSFQVLINLVNPINWLFSGRNGLDENVKVSNGFATTGGLFSRVAVINFYDETSRQSSSVTIRQEYQGVDSQSKDLVVKTEIDGTIPNIDADAQVIFRDYKHEYTRYNRGVIRSNGELSYEVTSTRNSQAFKTYRIDYSDEFNFVECPHLDDQGSISYRVNSKKVFVRFTKDNSLVRFSSANYIYPSEMADDPCELNSCSIYAECIADTEMPTNYSCVCKVGFEGDGFNCYDVDECETGESNCDANAACYNYVGHHECICRSPYIGNGIECNYEMSCNSCDPNAVCIEAMPQKKCVCRSGFFGDGFVCKQDTSDCQCGDNADCLPNYETGRQECKCRQGFRGDGLMCIPLPCNEYSNCNENAVCFMNKRGSYECQCSQGYIGDGYKCSTQSCDILNNCGDNAQCVPDPNTLQHACVCVSGYIGNGYQCSKDAQTCDVLKDCHQYGECLFDERIDKHTCKCKPGYTGNGYFCLPINSCKDKSTDVCDLNADCIYDVKIKEHVCKCKQGFEGNGLRSKCFVDESYGLYLIYAQGASLHKIPFKTTDEDTIYPHKNRIVHVPGQTSVAISYDCHEQYIYWSDVSSNVINKIRADGSNYTIVLNNVKSAEGLAIDWISRNLYFTDSESRTIEVASLNGQYRKTLIKTHLSNPRGIAVDPIDGYIFWTDWNRKGPKIERSNMDGTHRKVIVNTDLGVPNGLYFDQKRQEVCWADAKTNRIECVEKDGSSRRVVAQINQIYPFDLTEVRTNIYWSDWSKKEIQNVDKSGVIGQPIKLSIGGSGRVYGILAVKNMCPRGTNACDRTNGGCNQLCLPKPDFNRQCACSDDANYECTRTLTL